jgi:hypothetical protein
MRRPTTMIAIAVTTAFYATVSFARDVEPAPADPAVKVPVTTYESVLEGYKPFQAQEPDSWREDNDEVGRIGGHPGSVEDSAMNGPATGMQDSEKKEIEWWPSLGSTTDSAGGDTAPQDTGGIEDRPRRSTWGPTLERKSGGDNE